MNNNDNNDIIGFSRFLLCLRWTCIIFETTHLKGPKRSAKKAPWSGAFALKTLRKPCGSVASRMADCPNWMAQKPKNPRKAEQCRAPDHEMPHLQSKSLDNLMTH